MKSARKSLFLAAWVAIIFNSFFAYAASSRSSSIRTFGDYMQGINPLFACTVASAEKGAGHFGLIYGQTFLSMHSIKLLGNGTKWKASKRPHIIGKKDRYDGMPSGHTASAWVAAAYIRTFSEDYKILSIPLYITAGVTGYSRIKAKEHTLGQVFAGAALAELITYVNSGLSWSNEYRSSTFYLGEDELTARFVFKF